MAGGLTKKVAALVVAAVACPIIGVLRAGPTLANDPQTPPGGFTFTERPNTPPGPGYNPDIPASPPPYGGSIWSYTDSNGNAQAEGSYQPFDDQVNQEYSSNAYTAPDGSAKRPGPHGFYSTAGNKCAVCHAVHRATGSYRLLRVDNPDNACDYCHVGTHRHSARAAYNDAGTIYPSNGHTIGAGPVIPDSTTWQWTTPKTLTAANGVTREIGVRSYDAAKNQMFKWSQSDAGWVRTGPVSLQCTTCHQVHNASELIWKPNGEAGAENGYKLLRNSPSGSVGDPGQMRSYAAGSQGDPSPIGNPVTVVEGVLSSSTTGPGKTIYTRWKGPDVVIDQYSSAVWCADCHNLDIGFKEAVPSNFGGWSHSDRTHPVPFGFDAADRAGDVNGQCYSCHLNDLQPGMTGSSCGTCHMTPKDYAAQAAASDFPHSGQAAGYKMLGDDLRAAGGPNNLVTAGTIDAVCERCHTDIGVMR